MLVELSAARTRGDWATVADCIGIVGNLVAEQEHRAVLLEAGALAALLELLEESLPSDAESELSWALCGFVYHPGHDIVFPFEQVSHRKCDGMAHVVFFDHRS